LSAKQQMEIGLSKTVEPLILDLVEWVAKAPRPYIEVMDAWRTSCPRLTVWEDAVDHGYLVRERQDGGEVLVKITPLGRRHLRDSGRVPAAGDASPS
jgi:hypothetical protein